MIKIKIPIYNQFVYVERGLRDNDFSAKVEFEPITLRYNEKILTLKILAHECVHITNQICKGCLLDFESYDNDEWYAYLYAEVFNKIYKAVKGDIK